MKHIYTIISENACGAETDRIEIKCEQEQISEELIKLLQNEWKNIIYAGDSIRILHE